MSAGRKKLRKQRPAKTSKQRLEARISSEQKLFFKRAASLRGISLTDFMIDAMQEAAVKAVEQHELMTLNARESKLFIDALLNPPEPNEALQFATRRYTEMVAR